MAAQWFPYQALDANGAIVSGALANFYASGTTTPQDVFTDTGLTVPATNPTVASSTGNIGVYLDDSLDYDIDVRDSGGATIILQGTYVGSTGILTITQASTASINGLADAISALAVEIAIVAANDLDISTVATNIGSVNNVNDALVSGELENLSALIPGSDDFTISGNTTTVSGVLDFFEDDSDKSGVNISRFRDRAFFGDAVDHTGNRTSSNGLGSDWVSTEAANWISKNSLAMSQATNRVALTGAAWTPPGESSVTNIGVLGLTLNEGVNSTSRAIYAEAMHNPTGGGGATAGIEIQVGNFTNVMPSPTPYNVGTGVSALFLGVEAGHNYVLGDNDTPILTPTMPAALALDISAGSIAALYQKFVGGIVFRQNALYRDIDGDTGNADAIMMAEGHQLKWFAADTVVGAVIRADNTALANQDVGLIFSNNSISLTGTSEARVAEFQHSASATEYLQFLNGSTPTIQAAGTATNVSINLTPKGTGEVVVNGDLSATGGPLVHEFDGTISVTGTATTVTSVSDQNITYDVIVKHSAGNAATCRVAGDETTPQIIYQDSGGSANFTFSLSGTNLQIANTDGFTYSCRKFIQQIPTPTS